MAKMSCFSFMLGGKVPKRSKGGRKVDYAKKANGNDCPKVNPVEFMDMADTVHVSKGGGDSPACDTNVFLYTAAQSARQVPDDVNEQDKAFTSNAGLVAAGEDCSGDNTKNAVKSAEPDSGEPSGVGPELKRTCSNIETARSVPAEGEFDLPAKSRSYADLKALPSGARLTTPSGVPDASPTASVRTSRSADRVMLKKRSSRQVLPSRSRKLWWRLLLRSHRNLRRPGSSFSMSALPSADTYGVSNQNTSGMVDASTVATTRREREPKNKEVVVVQEEPVPNRWVTLSAETVSSLDRVRAWVNSLHVADEEDVTKTDHDNSTVHAACCSEIVECSTAAEKQTRAKRRTAEKFVQASSNVQTLNTVSSVAHISSMGLHAVPTIAAFSSLRAVNLSGNFIVHIHPGSLPKGLHSLDLSRNKIASVEGLRELTRLRVLNLSYNRISRIGHGLSSCTATRELYLAGNKISDVEGLHRLLKLAILDVGFNRITTAKSLGQLVANYGSLRALNLMGNPVQANLGDDALRKAVAGLLPRLEYLNKEAVKPRRAGEVPTDSVAKAALGANSGWGARRRTSSRRVSQSPGSSTKSRGGRRSRSRTRGEGSSRLSRK